jgi:hypothetical protein
MGFGKRLSRMSPPTPGERRRRRSGILFLFPLTILGDICNRNYSDFWLDDGVILTVATRHQFTDTGEPETLKAGGMIRMKAISWRLVHGCVSFGSATDWLGWSIEKRLLSYHVSNTYFAGPIEAYHE